MVWERLAIGFKENGRLHWLLGDVEGEFSFLGKFECGSEAQRCHHNASAVVCYYQ